MKPLLSYYDGHYIDSGKTQEERDLLDKQVQEECEALISWDEVQK